MVKRNGSYPAKRVENMKDGEGFVTLESLLTPDELYNKGRLFSVMTIDPGSSIGYHVHEGEMEAYYVLSGEAELDDNGETVALNAGDTVYTADGKGHSVKNAGATPLKILAVILFT